MRTPDDIRDEWLVLRCQTGDTAAPAELVEHWYPRLLRHAQRLTGVPDAAGAATGKGPATEQPSAA